MESLRNSVKQILLKAGIEIVEQKGDLTPGQLLDLMLSANCSMHILGSIDICDPDSGVYHTPPAQHYRTAKGIDSKDYKMFVWNPSGTINDNNQYVNIVRRDIDDNTIYSDITSPIVFVEELRSIMNVLAFYFVNSVNIEFEVVPRRRVGNHIPAYCVGSVFFNYIKRIYSVAETFRHFQAILVEHKSV